MADAAQYDRNLRPSLLALSNGDNKTPVTLWADPTSHALVVSASLAKDTLPVAGATQAVSVAVVDTSGNQITSFGGGTVPIADSTPASGNLTALNTTYDITVAGYNSLSFVVSGTWVGTISFFATSNGSTFIATHAFSVTNMGAQPQTTINDTFIPFFNAGMQKIRCQMTAYTSGTATITSRLSSTQNYERVYEAMSGMPIPSMGAAVMGSDGTNAQFIKTSATGVVKVDGSGVTQPVQDISAEASLVTIAANTGKSTSNVSTIQGEDIAITAPGNQLVSLSGPTGDPIDTINDSLSVTATNNGSLIRSDPGQNAQLMSGNTKIVPFSTPSVQAVGTTDALNYKYVSVQVNSQGTASTITFQMSNDGVTWVSAILSPASVGSATLNLIATTTTVGIWSGQVQGRYFRLNITGITALTTAGTIVFSALPNVPAQIGAAVQYSTLVANVDAITTSGNAIAAASQGEVYNGATWDRWRSVSAAAGTTGLGIASAGVLGIFNNVPPSVASGTYERLQLDNNANLKVVLPTGRALSTDIVTIGGDSPMLTAEGTQLVSLAGPTGDPLDTTGNSLNVRDTGLSFTSGALKVDNSAVTQPVSGTVTARTNLVPANTSLNPYAVHITTNTTTTPTSATAYISAISISSEVGGTTSTVTIQDKSGTPLKLINGLSTTALTTTPTTVNFQTPVLMTGGIDIITAGAVAATIDVWVNYFA